MATISRSDQTAQRCRIIKLAGSSTAIDVMVSVMADIGQIRKHATWAILNDRELNALEKFATDQKKREAQYANR